MRKEDEHENIYFMAEPSVNAKCIVFSGALAALYWYAPPRNKWILLALLTLPYLGLAWYDHHYMCQQTMGPTYLSLFYARFKPDASAQIEQYKKWHPAIKEKVLMVDCIILALLLCASPAFMAWKPS
jgi:hypothetical protein